MRLVLLRRLLPLLLVIHRRLIRRRSLMLSGRAVVLASGSTVAKRFLHSIGLTGRKKELILLCSGVLVKRSRMFLGLLMGLLLAVVMVVLRPLLRRSVRNSCRL
jgi:tetrahydromethanopterin S-methyltransferase subunit F